MKTALLLLLVVASSASAQVVSGGDKCSGKNCTVQTLKVTGSTIPLNGIYTPSAGKLALSANGAEVASVDSNGLSIWFSGSGAELNFLANGGAIGDVYVQRTSTEQLQQGAGTASIYKAGFFASGGSALTTGNACTAGTTSYDTGSNCWKDCGGSAVWSGCRSTAGAVQAYAPWSTYCEKAACTKAEAAADAFLMPYTDTVSSQSTPIKLTCNWRTAGTGGTTGVVAAIFNATDSTELCSVTLGACTTASGVALNPNLSCGALVAGKVYVLRLKSTTDCTTIPGLIGCTVTLQQ